GARVPLGAPARARGGASAARPSRAEGLGPGAREPAGRRKARADDDALAVVPVEDVRDRRSLVHVRGTETPAGHARLVSPSIEAAAAKADRAGPSESQSEVHARLITDRAIPWGRVFGAALCRRRLIRGVQRTSW